MGKIKKILEKELGSTQSVEVYPVTSIEAVYDENNERLDNIINRKNNEIQRELKAEVARASNAESNLRETINNLTEINENATSANIVTIDNIPNTSSSNVQQALNELFKNATFAGIATPTTNPGTPDGPVFYIATEAGTYSNFDGISVAEGEAVILQWDNGTWTKKVTGFATQEELLALRDLLSSPDKDITSKFSIVSGRQAYGNVGSIVKFGVLPEGEYTVVDIEGVYAKFKSAPRAQVSSYIQYTDTNGIIVSRKFENIGNNVECEELIEFPEGATKCYITGAKGTISIVEKGKSIIAEIGKLEDITVAENSKSIVDAINKACTLSITRNATVLNKDDAFDMWGQSNTNTSFLTGEVGSKITVLTGGDDVRNIKIPVKDGYMITYPMFKTSQRNGSFLVDSNNIILEAFINSTEPNGTMNTITINGYGNKEVYFYLSLYPYSSVTQKITIQTGGEVTTKQIPINKYLSKLLSNNYKENVSEEKALTTFGASKMYEELSNRMSSDSSVLFPCKDYGVMPSCQYGDSKAFLQDGVDEEGNAIIKYSDVIAKYDELMSAYPNYIKKKELGYDASGTIPMYAYTFKPKYPTQSIYLQAGVHGWEPDPVFALAMIATLIANAYGTTDGNGLKVDDDALKYIRENVKITIVPCVNPYGFNNRADCGIDKRGQAQNNANGVQLNGAWTGNAAEAVAVRGLIEELKQELSFAIDMHSTVWENSRDKYGCFYGGVNSGSASLLAVFKTYEWLYRFYDMKYPSIVQGDSVPNLLGEGYASIGTMTGTFNSWIYSTYGIESTTMEFSDHVWTPELHTSVAMSVAVNMYLNQFVQHICARFKSITPKVDSSDIYPAKG